MLPFLTQQEQRRDEHGRHIPPVYLLTVFKEVDLVVWHPPTRFLRVENEIAGIQGLHGAVAPAGNLLERSTDVFGPSTFTTVMTMMNILSKRAISGSIRTSALSYMLRRNHKNK